ncbi:MAG: HDOD domain-containing protein [Leptospiraceae bacterium]|nr:HDOD domain-containing protein [Leptospiraceae bacterium]
MESKVTKEQLEGLLQKIEGLPSMPALVQKLEQMMSDPDVNVQALSREIALDPGITASLIRLSNSAYYMPARPIRSVAEAIMTLGLSKVKEIVLVVAARGFLKVDLEAFKVKAPEIWDHSLLAAEISALIARKLKGQTTDDVAYTAGLLHDTGKIVLAQHLAKKYQLVQLAMSQNPDQSILDLEREHLGFTHVEIGASLMDLWEMPTELTDAVRFVYEPEKSSGNQELCAIVNVANAIVLSAGVGVDVGGLSMPLSQFAMRTLNFSDRDMEFYYTSVPELMEKLADLRTF